jgi:thymidylate synthase
LRMVCHLSGCIPKELCLVMCDAHIYANHIDQVRTQIARSPYRFPKLEIVRTPEEIGCIDNFTSSDFRLVGYKAHPRISAPMAV